VPGVNTHSAVLRTVTQQLCLLLGMVAFLLADMSKQFPHLLPSNGCWEDNCFHFIFYNRLRDPALRGAGGEPMLLLLAAVHK